MSIDSPFAGVQKSGGNYYRADKIGDSVAGVITWLGLGKDFNEVTCPEIHLDTADGEVKVTCAQANLKNQIIDLGSALKIGDKLGIKYDSEVKAARGNVKIFVVQHKPAAGAAKADDLF